MALAVRQADIPHIPAAIEREQPTESAPEQKNLFQRVARRAAWIAGSGLLGTAIGFKLGSLVAIPLVLGCAVAAVPLAVPAAVLGAAVGMAIGSVV